MANLFADLPHLVGTITNLDANQANRALVSIKAELKKASKESLRNTMLTILINIRNYLNKVKYQNHCHTYL